VWVSLRKSEEVVKLETRVVDESELGKYNRASRVGEVKQPLIRPGMHLKGPQRNGGNARSLRSRGKREEGVQADRKSRVPPVFQQLEKASFCGPLSAAEGPKGL